MPSRIRDALREIDRLSDEGGADGPNLICTLLEIDIAELGQALSLNSRIGAEEVVCRETPEQQIDAMKGSLAMAFAAGVMFERARRDSSESPT